PRDFHHRHHDSAGIRAASCEEAHVVGSDDVPARRVSRDGNPRESRVYDGGRAADDDSARRTELDGASGPRAEDARQRATARITYDPYFRSRGPGIPSDAEADRRGTDRCYTGIDFDRRLRPRRDARGRYAARKWHADSWTRGLRQVHAGRAVRRRRRKTQ